MHLFFVIIKEKYDLLFYYPGLETNFLEIFFFYKKIKRQIHFLIVKIFINT